MEKKYTLDKIDRRLLVELEFNARMSLTALGKKVRLSPQRVKYRVDNLVKRGIIRSFVPLVNVANLGYEYYRIYFRYERVDSKKEKEIVDYFVGHPHVYWAAGMIGRWDLQVLVLARNFIHFNELYNAILEKFGNHLRQNVTSVSIKNYHKPRSYLLGKNSEGTFLYGGEPQVKHLDEVDKKILSKLNSNARIPVAEIAHGIGMTAKSVMLRMKKLEKEHIIEAYRTWIDVLGLGYSHYKVLIRLRTLNTTTVRKLLEFCKNQKHVTYMITCVWPWNLELEIEVNHDEQLLSLLRSFQEQFGEILLDQEVVKIYTEHKLRYLPDISLLERNL